jgi:hypothetical protein
MVSRESIENQLHAINFNQNGWGRTEVGELPSIILPDEVIYECVNGIYEGGFALLVATDVRVLLVDKKPLNYLTVEDLRFDMINELDYSHRVVGAYISISAGSKSLRFTSLNQRRLRKLITHVQHCMADAKKQQAASQVDQKQHLERINQQLQTYLLAQHRHQTELGEQLKMVNEQAAQKAHMQELTNSSQKLNDYLYAQGDNAELMQASKMANQQMSDEIYEEGMREIFGQPSDTVESIAGDGDYLKYSNQDNGLTINPLKIAYSKLPENIKNKSLPKAPNIEVPVPSNNHQLPVTD